MDSRNLELVKCKERHAVRKQSEKPTKRYAWRPSWEKERVCRTFIFDHWNGIYTWKVQNKNIIMVQSFAQRLEEDVNTRT